MTYLITFGVEPSRNATLAAAIKAMGEWGEFAPNSYLLASERTVRAIIETLQPLLGPKDSLAVLTASAPWAASCNPNAETIALSLLGENEPWIHKDRNDSA